MNKIVLQIKTYFYQWFYNLYRIKTQNDGNYG